MYIHALGLILLDLPLLFFADLILFLKLIHNDRSTHGTQASADSGITPRLLQMSGYFYEALSKSSVSFHVFGIPETWKRPTRSLFKTIHDQRCIPEHHLFDRFAFH